MDRLIISFVVMVGGLITLTITSANIGILSEYRREFQNKGDMEKVKAYNSRIAQAKSFLRYFLIIYLLLVGIICLVMYA